VPAQKPPSRWKAVCRAWPPAGAVFGLLAFLVTLFWLFHTLTGWPGHELNWLEPLTIILAGLGGFILAVILITRKLDNSAAEAGGYRLARGLATGYYFNFVRPLTSAIRDPAHALHQQVAATGGHRIVGVVIGIPQTLADFDTARHDALLRACVHSPTPAYELRELEVTVADRPRPVSAKLALSTRTRAALVVDLPTTLAVIPDFAEFVARQDADAAAEDEFVSAARRQSVAQNEAEQFRDVLEEFLDVTAKAGAQEPRGRSPTGLLHIVPVHRLRRRMDELADH
jgi:hypothetical protein